MSCIIFVHSPMAKLLILNFFSRIALLFRFPSPSPINYCCSTKQHLYTQSYRNKRVWMWANNIMFVAISIIFPEMHWTRLVWSATAVDECFSPTLTSSKNCSTMLHLRKTSRHDSDHEISYHHHLCEHILNLVLFLTLANTVSCSIGYCHISHDYYLYIRH